MTISWLIGGATAALGVIWLLSTPERLETPEIVSGRVSYVVDGDSLYVHGHKPQVRLWGVDAPERKEAGFKEATNTLKAITDRQHLICNRVDTDRYGRTVARCFLKDGRELNRLMIESGKAREHRRFSKGFYSH